MLIQKVSSFCRRHLGELLVLIAGISWGVLSIFVRELNHLGIQPLSIVALRSIGAALVLSASLGITNRKAFKIKPKDMWCMIGGGIISMTLFNFCYFHTVQRTTVNVAIVLLYTSPAFISIMARFFFKERLSVHKISAILLVIFGCALTSGILEDSDTQLTPLGLLLGVGAGFFYGLYTIFGRFAQKRNYSSSSIVLWSFLFASIPSLFILIANPPFGILFNSPMACWSLAGLVLISTILPYITYTTGLQYLQPSVAAVIVAIEPIVGTLAGIFLFHEPIQMAAIIGMILVLIAIALSSK